MRVRLAVRNRGRAPGGSTSSHPAEAGSCTRQAQGHEGLCLDDFPEPGRHRSPNVPRLSEWAGQSLNLSLRLAPGGQTPGVPPRVRTGVRKGAGFFAKDASPAVHGRGRKAPSALARTSNGGRPWQVELVGRLGLRTQGARRVPSGLEAYRSLDHSASSGGPLVSSSAGCGLWRGLSAQRKASLGSSKRNEA